MGGASGSLGQQATASVPASPGPPSPSKRKPLSEVNDNFRKLLMAAPGRLLPFKLVYASLFFFLFSFFFPYPEI